MTICSTMQVEVIMALTYVRITAALLRGTDGKTKVVL